MVGIKRVYDDSECKHKEYTSKGVGGTALGLSIGGVALGGGALLWNALKDSKSSKSMPDTVNINVPSTYGYTSGSSCQPTAFQSWEKACNSELVSLDNMYQLYINGLNRDYATRQTDISEKFSLYKSQTDGDFANYKAVRDLYDSTQERLNNTAFGLYKSQRDGYDALVNRIGQLEKQVAVSEGIRPYQDKLIMCEIEKAYTAAVNRMDRLDCRNIKGVLGLPTTPEVTVLEGATCCNRNQAA